jgi:hypothetical protein
MGSPISDLKMRFMKESKIQSVRNTKGKDVLLPHLEPTLTSTELAMIVTKKRKETIYFYLQCLINRI